MAKGTVVLPLERSMFRAGDRVACAISGGADSVALLLALAEANARRDSLGVVLSAAHVHHGLRGAAADRDAEFVRALCERLGVPLAVLPVDTPARQQESGEGVEEAARTLRYQALRKLAARERLDAVATAHTLNDQAETVLMKLLRGAWTEGLAGIAPVVEGEWPGTATLAGGRGTEAAASGQARVVRPLLQVTRAEIEAFLRARGETWREDETNRDTTFLRNRVRHELLPVLRQFNPGIDGLLAGLSAIARDEEAFWAGEVARVLPQLLLPGRPVRGGGRAAGGAAGEACCAVEIERLRSLPPALRRRVLRAAARSLDVRLSAEETARVVALTGLGSAAGAGADGPSSVRIGSRLELHDGLRVERTARELQFRRAANH